MRLFFLLKQLVDEAEQLSLFNDKKKKMCESKMDNLLKISSFKDNRVDWCLKNKNN
jgi:hypothetical protein